jgi:2-polyprenyl-3-methyl-5-hydroxy-6-metoxy-1,4-benzoquinol methylase
LSNRAPADVYDIVADLQAEVRRQQKAPNPDFEANGPLAAVRQYQYVNSHLPIGWPVMPQGVVNKLRAYGQKVVRRLLRWYINPLVDQQNQFNHSVADLLARLDYTSRSHAANLEELRQLTASDRAHVDAARDQIQSVLQQLQAGATQSQLQLVDFQKQQLDLISEIQLRLQRMENWYRNAAASTPPVAAPSESPLAAAPPTQAPDVDYFLLGVRWRNENQTLLWLDDYLDVFGPLLQGELAGPVLDIGCGRGQLVAHLNELGLDAYGIDMDTDAIQIGQANHRKVYEGDAMAHLRGLADQSLAAVVLIQVIEHFEVPYLLQTLQLITQKLKPGGFVIAETVNPVCVWAMSNWFLMDPSHKGPLHPQLTRFLMEQAGLSDVQIRGLHPVPEGGRLRMLELADPLPALQTLVQECNRNTQQLNDFLYGPQDYAAIAYRRETA